MRIKKVLMALALVLIAALPLSAAYAEPYLSLGIGVTGGADGTGGVVGGDAGITAVTRIGGDITPDFALYFVGSVNAQAAPWEPLVYYGAMADAGIGVGGAVRWGIAALHVDLQGIIGATSDIIDSTTGYPGIYMGGRLTLEPEVMIAPAREWFGFALSFPISVAMTTMGWDITGGVLISFSLGDHLEGY